MTSIFIASNIGLWLLTLSRVPRLFTGPHRRGRDGIFSAALIASLAATIACTDLYVIIEEFLSMANSSAALCGALTMISFGLFRACVVRAVVDPAVQADINRKGMKFTAAAVTAYVMSFLCASFTGSTTMTPRDAAAESDVAVFIFSAIFCSFMAVVGVNLMKVCRDHIPAMSSRLFSAGFTLVMTGTFCGLVALALTAVRQVLILVSGQSDWSMLLPYFYSAIGATGLALFATGLSLPSISNQLRQLELPIRFRLMTLHLIWRRCAGTGSSTILDHRRSPLASSFSRNPTPRLHRILVEILDGNLVSRGELLSPSELRWVRRTEKRLFIHS